MPETYRPSGEQVVLEAADQRVTIVEVGGGIREYLAAGRPVLDGYAEDAMASSARGAVLAPWPNRLDGGRYTFDGRELRLPLNELPAGNAIHGRVRWVGWTVAARATDRCVMTYVLQPHPGYPFRVALRVEYRLDARGLHVHTTATNLGATACPFGAGAHPWFTVGTPVVDSAVLRVPARTGIWTDDRGIPNRTGPVDGTELDFRTARPIGEAAIDNGFTDLEPDADDITRVTLADPGVRSTTLWFDRAYPFLMLSTGDVLPDVRRRSVAIEPMTCPPNALQTGAAVIRLEPGDSFSGNWGISPH